MKNADIADALDELADLNELDGAVVYRVVAYRQAARAVRESPVAVAQLAEQDRLTGLKGVGKTIAEKIGTLLETGEIPAATKLKGKFPPGLVEITRISGLGPKTARKIHAELGIGSLEELKEAAMAERLRDVPGLGEKVERKILQALETPTERATDRRILSHVLPLAEEIVAELRAHPVAERVELAGSLRRWSETCKDIDIVAAAGDPRALGEALAALEVVLEARVGRRRRREDRHPQRDRDRPEGRGHGAVRQPASAPHRVEAAQHGAARVRGEEGPARERVRDRGRRHRHEAHLRDGAGGLRAARTRLRRARAARGQAASSRPLARATYRSSSPRATSRETSTATRPRPTAETLSRRWPKAARERGYKYLAITDHSASFGFGNDVQADELLRQAERVRELNAGVRGFKVLIGSEVNILPDGSLDYPDDVLAELDWVIASVHSSFQMKEKAMTERIMAAMDNVHVDAIGHLTGRRLLVRDPYPLDVERIAAHAAATGTMLEINGNPDRRDLSDLHARLAAEAGVMLVVNSDAHGVETLRLIRYGVATARRAWLSKDQIANTRPLREFMKLRKRARR